MISMMFIPFPLLRTWYRWCSPHFHYIKHDIDYVHTFPLQWIWYRWCSPHFHYIRYDIDDVYPLSHYIKYDIDDVHPLFHYIKYDIDDVHPLFHCKKHDIDDVHPWSNSGAREGKQFTFPLNNVKLFLSSVRVHSFVIFFRYIWYVQNINRKKRST